MIEQPFPYDFIKSDNAIEWKEIKTLYENNGILIFADESVRGAQDIKTLKDFVSGVNIKLEKAGGLRAAVTAIFAAKELKLKVWLGMMVGSHLSASTVAHLSYLADFGVDLDGSLLVDEKSNHWKGGFDWKGPESDRYGFACWPSEDKILGSGIHI